MVINPLCCIISSLIKRINNVVNRCSWIWRIYLVSSTFAVWGAEPNPIKIFFNTNPHLNIGFNIPTPQTENLFLNMSCCRSKRRSHPRITIFWLTNSEIIRLYTPF
ncbi:hypothetical protein SAMN04489841_1057 [Natrinema salaciae]|uniref:Uncharacterized protein n=1 Tax=Natrinema salaciae TaxID=1186196 RepID=A0A1H9CHK2_9EURY|nr:hypothetical protein SAMN04489841_1057 [Natrinema salaciae]